MGRTFSLPSQRNFPISFKPKVAIAKFIWERQKKVWYYEKWVGRHASFPPRRSVEILAILLLHTIEFCVLGTLAPSLKPSKSNDTIDLIFATHWIYPSQTPVLQADDEKCVNDELSKRSGKNRS